MQDDERCLIVAFVTPKPEEFDRVKAILEAIIPEVHNEPGCDFYALHLDSLGRLAFIEAWTTRALWLEHMEAPTVARIREQTSGLLAAETEIFELSARPVGGAKGLVPSTV